jgi:hypothetical protein
MIRLSPAIILHSNGGKTVRGWSGSTSFDQTAEQFVADSLLQGGGFELAVRPEGKGYGEPLHASIAVSDLNL